MFTLFTMALNRVIQTRATMHFKAKTGFEVLFTGRSMLPPCVKVVPRGPAWSEGAPEAQRCPELSLMKELTAARHPWEPVHSLCK